MTDRHRILVLVFFYFLGIAGGWGFYLYKRPTAEQRFVLQVDQAIREDLCKRIAADLKHFEASPQTFKRSSLRVLASESTAVAQTHFVSSDGGEVVKFRSANGAAIVSDCPKDAQRWVKINSMFPELYEAELAIVDGHKLPDVSISNSASKALPSSNQGKRLALVIGNSNYENRPLTNPVNDAKDVGGTLRDAGFSILELYDADLKGMRDTVKIFSERLKDYDVGLIYYSGHGIEFAGRNYFIPVDADIRAEDEIPRQGFDATEIVETMSRSNVKTSIFIFDACRNAPIFSSFRSAKSGLAIMQGSSGSLVAYSAAPGQVALDGNGRNSPYTSVLLQQLQMPNKKIEDVVKDTARLVSENTQGRQVPWYNSSLVGDFYFIKQ